MTNKQPPHDQMPSRWRNLKPRIEQQFIPFVVPPFRASKSEERIETQKNKPNLNQATRMQSTEQANFMILGNVMFLQMVWRSPCGNVAHYQVKTHTIFLSIIRMRIIISMMIINSRILIVMTTRTLVAITTAVLRSIDKQNKYLLYFHEAEPPATSTLL